MNRYTFFMVPILGLVFGVLQAAPGEPGEGAFWGVTPHLLWSGSVETEKDLINRGDLRLELPWQGLSLRTQLVDKRPLGELFSQGNTAFGGGLYHGSTGSRLLYGILDELGLPARVRSPWIRALPFPEYHRASAGDLKVEPSSVKGEEAYLYLAPPRLGPLGAFASVLVEQGLVPAFGGGLDFRFNQKTELRLEGFHTRRTLPSRGASAWFSEAPPLPERDFRLYALALLFNSPLGAVSSDWAFSETFAYGRDFYGNLGIRLGDKPWRLALAVDAAGARYVGRDGSAPGGGLRAGARLERRGTRNSLFRLGAAARSPGLGEPFAQGSGQIYYRFPELPSRVPRFSRVSLNLDRKASDPAKVEDTLEGLFGLKWGDWSALFQGSLKGRGTSEEQPLPFPLPDGVTSYDTAGISGELGWSPGNFSFSIKLGYRADQKKEAFWDASFHASIRGKPGRLSLNLASPRLPGEWSGTVSWRLELPRRP